MNSRAKERRNAVILDMYYDYLAENGWTNPDDFAEWLSKQPAPGFYQEFENARRIVSLILRGKELPLKMNKLLKKMFYDMAELLKKHPEYNPKKTGRYLLLEEIMDCPAPSFYLSKDRIRSIVYEEMRNRLRVKKND